MIHGKRMIMACLLVCGGITLTLWAADLTLDQVPAAAREALLKLAGDNKIVSVETEKENGIQVYEAEWVARGVSIEAEVTADGVLLEMEEDVKADSVPEAVRTTAEKALAGADKITYEKHTVVFYEVEGKVAGKGKEVSISPAGKLMDNEDEDEADEEDDAKEGK